MWPAIKLLSSSALPERRLFGQTFISANRTGIADFLVMQAMLPCRVTRERDGIQTMGDQWSQTIKAPTVQVIRTVKYNAIGHSAGTADTDVTTGVSSGRGFMAGIVGPKSFGGSP
jgi:hypothetical protein